jgi:molybdopterin-containing oxidoreductase family membrane subunit
MYAGTFWDYATLFGSMGLFLFLLLMFMRLLPMISMSELREHAKPQLDRQGAKDSAP